MSWYCMGNITKRRGFSFKSGSILGSKLSVTMFGRIVAQFGESSNLSVKSFGIDNLRTLFELSVSILRGL